MLHVLQWRFFCLFPQRGIFPFSPCTIHFHWNSIHIHPKLLFYSIPHCILLTVQSYRAALLTENKYETLCLFRKCYRNAKHQTLWCEWTETHRTHHSTQFQWKQITYSVDKHLRSDESSSHMDTCVIQTQISVIGETHDFESTILTWS